MRGWWGQRDLPPLSVSLAAFEPSIYGFRPVAPEPRHPGVPVSYFLEANSGARCHAGLGHDPNAEAVRFTMV